MRNRSTPTSTSTGHTASRNTAAKTSVPSDALGATFLAAKATAKCPMNTSSSGAQPGTVQTQFARAELDPFVDPHTRHLDRKRLYGEKRQRGQQGFPHRVNSGAFVQAREDELAMSERFRGGEPAVRGTQHHLEELVTRLVHVDLLARYTGHVDVDVFGHEAHRARVGADLDDGQDGIADDVALAGGEEMHRVAACRAQCHHLRRCGGRIHEPQAGAARNLGLVEHAVYHAFLPDLLDVAERFLLDGGEAPGDIALGGLRIHEIARFVAVDHFLVAVEHEHELVAHLGRPATRGHELLAAGKLRRFPENERHAVFVELVEGVSDAGVGAYPGSGVRFSALGRYPQVLERPLLATQLRSPLHVILRRLGGAADRFRVTVAFDAEEGHGFPRRGDAVGDALRPAVLDADHHRRGDVGIGPRADQRLEVQLEVRAELQPPVGMRDRERPLDVVRYRFTGRVGEIVDGQDKDVVSNADATVVAFVSPECRFAQIHAPTSNETLNYSHQRLVLILCTWACSPTLMGAMVQPISTPYLITVSPLLSSRIASLWPMGTSLCARTLISLSWSMIHPVSSCPAFIPSTTTTPTESFSSCTTK